MHCQQVPETPLVLEKVKVAPSFVPLTSLLPEQAVLGLCPSSEGDKVGGGSWGNCSCLTTKITESTQRIVATILQTINNE